MQQLEKLVYSSFNGNLEPAFAGYCFSDANYVYGEIGRRLFEEATGEPIMPGLDGCYVSVRKTDQGIEAGVDGAGLAQIFYFQKDGGWAFANSLEVLVDHLRANDIHPQANISQLKALGTLATVTSQVSSFSTIFEDVFLLPSHSIIRATPAGLEIADLPVQQSWAYETVISSFLSIWIARISTLLTDPEIRVVADLTGGIDSRTMFSILQAADTSDHSTGRPFFRSGVGEKYEADFKVASSIARAHRIELNSTVPGHAPREQGNDGYARWRQVCLGVYLSVYVRRHARDPYLHHFNGGGGENHRLFYPNHSMTDVLSGVRSRLSDDHFEKWHYEVSQSLALLTARNPQVAESVLHYREFRNRFHTGRAPHFSVEITPLSSTILNHLPADAKGLASRQFYFDVMETLSQGLMNFPYDDPLKAPSATNISRITLAPPAEFSSVGEVFAPAPSNNGRHENGDSRTAIEIFTTEAARALELDSVREFMPPRTLAKAGETIERLKRSKRLNHASEGKPLAYALAVAFALEA